MCCSVASRAAQRREHNSSQLRLGCWPGEPGSGRWKRDTLNGSHTSDQKSTVNTDKTFVILWNIHSKLGAEFVNRSWPGPWRQHCSRPLTRPCVTCYMQHCSTGEDTELSWWWWLCDGWSRLEGRGDTPTLSVINHWKMCKLKIKILSSSRRPLSSLSQTAHLRCRACNQEPWWLKIPIDKSKIMSSAIQIFILKRFFSSTLHEFAAGRRSGDKAEFYF